ncbi:uncharacterized protein METZ01_LOCUS227176, partial [marine metagenome]
QLQIVQDGRMVACLGSFATQSAKSVIGNDNSCEEKHPVLA